MTIPTWQLVEPISAVIFDCDSTLSYIEGIDELAKQNGSYTQVQALTQQAMNTTGVNSALFRKRLDLVKPHQKHLIDLGQTYYHSRVPDIVEIILLLKRLQKSIYIVSAGFNPAITIFGELLQIPQQNIYAVNLEFDQDGKFLNFDVNSPLIERSGKCVIAEQLKKLHPNLIHIGDGANDIVTLPLVTRFIGYGGVVVREHVAKYCDYYIHTPSLTPLLPLILTQNEYQTLLPNEQILYHKGLTAIHAGRVVVK